MSTSSRWFAVSLATSYLLLLVGGLVSGEPLTVTLKPNELILDPFSPIFKLNCDISNFNQYTTVLFSIDGKVVFDSTTGVTGLLIVIRDLT